MRLTGKQEKFCQKVAEGLSYSDAYRAAYDAKGMKAETVHKRASELLENGEVTGRIEGLKEKVEKKLVYTAAESFEKMDDLLKMAIKSGAFNAAIKAEELKGKLANLYKPESSVNVNNKVVMPAVKVNGVSLNLKIGEGTLDD